MNRTSSFILCPHFKICSGCSLNEFVDFPPIFEKAKQFFKAKGVDIPPIRTGNTTGWRYRAKLAVRGIFDHPEIGLYEEGTHKIVDIPFCKVHHPQINETVKDLKKFIQQERLPPYDEQNHKGLVRYVQIFIERQTGRVQLSLVLNTQAISSSLKKALLQFCEETGGIQRWHSLWVNYNKRKDNVIFGKEWELIGGEPFLWQKFGMKEVCFHPSSFAQANLDLFEMMLKDIEKEVLEGTRVVDYYSGVGVIGLYLSDKGGEIHCCEVAAQANICFELSKSKLPHEVASKMKFYAGPVSDYLDLLGEADVIVVDPPRKGLDSNLLTALEALQDKKKLIYISCGWESFQKDCEILLKAGWKLEKAEAYLFFPGSNCIETLAIFY